MWPDIKFPPVNLYVVIPMGCFVSGCASVEEMQMAYQAQASIVASQTNQQQSPLFSLKCGSEEDSCKGLTFEYTPAKPQIQIPTVTNTNDTVLGIADPVVTGLGYVVGGITAIRLADKIMDNVGNGNVHTTSVTSTVGDNNNTSNDPGISKQSHDGTTDASNHSVTNTDNSVVNDSTHAPTIVPQPNPIVVKPEIVNPVVVK